MFVIIVLTVSKFFDVLLPLEYVSCDDYAVYIWNVIKKILITITVNFFTYKEFKYTTFFVRLLICLIPINLFIDEFLIFFNPLCFDERIATQVSKEASWHATNRAVNTEFNTLKTGVQTNNISYNDLSNKISIVIAHLQGLNAAERITISDLAVVKYVSTISPFSPQACFELKGLSNGLDCDSRNTGNTRCLLRNKTLVLTELRSKLNQRNMRIEALLN